MVPGENEGVAEELDDLRVHEGTVPRAQDHVLFRPGRATAEAGGLAVKKRRKKKTKKVNKFENLRAPSIKSTKKKEERKTEERKDCRLG